MKILWIFILLALSSCSDKDKVERRDELVGDWKWINTTGGIAGVNRVPEDGEIVILKLNNDYSFSQIDKGVEVRSGTYTLGNKTSMLFNKEMPVLTLNNSTDLMYSLAESESGLFLHLNEDYHDGFNYIYVKVK